MKRRHRVLVVFVGAALFTLVGCRGGGAFIEGLNQGLQGRNYQQHQRQQQRQEEREFRDRETEFYRMQQQQHRNNPHY